MLKWSEVSGFITLAVGIILLVFTFYNANMLLQGIRGLAASQDLMRAFGEALAPLIETCIRAIYLGIMGWIGSVLSMRGVQLLIGPRAEEKAKAKPEKKAEVKEEAREAEAKEEELAEPLEERKREMGR